MRLQRAADDEGRRHLSWMTETLSALGALQQQLHGPAGADFAVYLEEMRAQWRRRCAGRPIAIELGAEPLVMPENRVSALALIVNELVSNAIAHGFPDERAGVVKIELQHLGADAAALSVDDDGAGYDPDTVDKTRLGLWMVSGLAAQMRGALTTTIDNGVRCRLEFPVPAGPSAAGG
jgi:two-component sensor histidine kinase